MSAVTWMRFMLDLKYLTEISWRSNNTFEVNARVTHKESLVSAPIFQTPVLIAVRNVKMALDYFRNEISRKIS